MLPITFINENSEQNIKENGLEHLKSRKEDIEFYMNYESAHSDNDEQEFIELLSNNVTDLEELKKNIYQFEDLPPFNEYGLSYDYVEIENGKKDSDYFRYQFSWGGPSEEVRFYRNGLIEFVYLEWFAGIGFDVSQEEVFQWLQEYFIDIDMMEFRKKREETGYYDSLNYDEEDE